MKAQFDFEAPLVEIEKMIAKLNELKKEGNKDSIESQIKELEEEMQKRRKDIYSNLTPWQIVQIARHFERPVLHDYIDMIMTDFMELRGDRHFGDDQAVIGGLARLDNFKVMIIGHNKGKTIEENVKRNFGLSRPEGYRKALRLMKLAEKYGIPIICFIDTQGAYPVADAEERGQGEAIGRNIYEMFKLQVPIICIVTGEGGSGGALALGVGDVILMLSNAVYSVITPEGCASILWRDSSFAPQAAEALKITAAYLHKLGIADEVIEEPLGGAHTDYQAVAESIKKALIKHLKKLTETSISKLMQKRYEKYTSIGAFNS